MPEDRFRPPRRRSTLTPLCEILRAQIGTLILLVVVIAMLGDSPPPFPALSHLA